MMEGLPLCPVDGSQNREHDALTDSGLPGTGQSERPSAASAQHYYPRIPFVDLEATVEWLSLISVLRPSETWPV
jgi:hypothetical protein